MMKTICIHDRSQLEAFFRQDPFRNVFYLGDLDDSSWPNTTWYGLIEGDQLQAVALLYSGLSSPAFLCTQNERNVSQQRQLLESLLPLLPNRFDSFLGCDLDDILSRQYEIDSHGLHRRMGLIIPNHLPQQNDPRVALLSKADLPEVSALFDEGYPGNWFEPKVLDTNQYVGLRVDGALVSVAGVHVYSPVYRVAALGNIVTHPDYRGKGYGRTITGQLCRRLLSTVDHIGLNVKADNNAALACYASLGFEIIDSYGQITAERKTLSTTK